MLEIDIPVAGGSLRALSWPGDGPVVIAAHGLTANALASAGVAAALRGRAGTAHLPGPFDMAAHADDILAVASHHGADRPILVGHSMGAFVVAGTAARHPGRVGPVLMVDGGVALPVPPGFDVDAVLH